MRDGWKRRMRCVKISRDKLKEIEIDGEK